MISVCQKDFFRSRKVGTNVAFIVLAVILGYGSNAMSQTACLENAAFWYSHVIMYSQPYYVKLEPG